MDTDARALFLQKIHLFHNLKDDDLSAIAEIISEVSFPAGAVVFEQGKKADSFYLVYSGKVRVVGKAEGKSSELATFVSGDYFGEMALVSNQPRTARVEAVRDSICFRLSKDDFKVLLESYPSIKPNLEVAIASRRLARKLRFKWLGEDEVVYFLARKHSFFLMQVLVVPVMTLLIPAFVLLWGGLVGSTAAISFGFVALVMNLAWIVWRIIDWGNDYYVVTNERIVWLEKVIGLYDSRTEAPLSQVLSVDVETEMIGRMLDYGNVLVRTFVGAIPFMHVLHPNEAAQMVDEYWQRTKINSVQAEKEAFKEALRKRLGLIQPSDGEAPKQEETPALPKPNAFHLFVVNLFRQRLEAGNTITYRKHWFVLIKQVFFPSIFFIGLFILTGRRLFSLASDPNLSFFQAVSGDTLAIILPMMMFLVLGWWIYQYVDWTNDIFQVTGDQIFDIDKSPLGSEERSAAPVANILGTRYERIGFLGYLLNFGTVYIDIGSSQFTFEDVLDPAIVQSDIDRRRMMQAAAKKNAETADERNRLVDWMASYYQNIEEIQAELEARDAKKKNE